MVSSVLDYASLIEYSADACFSWNFNLGLIYITQGFVRMTGYMPDEILNQPDLMQDKFIHSANRSDFQDIVAHIKEGDVSEAAVVLQIIRRDCKPLWVDLFMIPARDDHNAIIGLDCCARDVSKQRETAHLLRRRMDELAVLLQVQRDLLSQANLQSTLELIVTKAKTLLGAKNSCVLLLESDKSTLKPVAYYGEYYKEIMALRLRIGEGFAGWAVQHGQPLLVNSALDDPRRYQVEGTPEQDESILCAPLKSGEEIIGTLVLGGEPHQFCDEDLNFLIALGHAASLGIDKSKLFEEVQRLAIVDDLTGAYNRNYFNKSLDNEIIRAKRLGYPIGLLFLDIDNLKEVNDTYGHVAGDQLLMAVVEIMKDHLRETDWVARYGGDEFAVILPGCPADKLLVVADKLMRALTKQTLVTEDGQDMPIRVSMGGAVFPDTVGRSAKAIDLLQAADLAERSAKKAGGSQFVLMQESQNGVE